MKLKALALVTGAAALAVSVAGTALAKVEGDTIILQDLICEEMHPPREILIENKAENVVTEFIRTHFSSQGVSDIPKTGF